MAATQAEKQQNDVNSEKVQPDQHLNVRNSLLQNGTDKSGVRGGGSVVVTKGKATGTMSQYRQDGANEQGMNEPDLGPTGSEAGLYPPAPAASSEGPPVGDGHGYGFPFGGRDMHNSSDGSLHGFASRQGFGGPKQPYQQRFVSGQTISQPTGPTPTLNQLLQQSSLQQSSNPMHRYQNNYGHPEQPYGQGWPPQKPLAPYSTAAGSAPGGTVYRNQSALSPAYSGAPAASPGYGEGRAGWPGPPVSGQHGPSSPGPPSATTIASQPSPQPTQQPSHSPGPGLPPSPQHPTTQPQHQNFPSRPAQPTTPNAHAPDSSVTLECYPPRPQSNIQYPNQGYGPPVSQTPLNSNIQPQQFPNRSTPNHMSNSQFPAYQQSWTGPITSSGNHLPGGKGNGPPQAPNSPSPCPPRPPHYLKQHLQHKMGFGNVPSSMPPSPSPPQNYHMGPPSASHHHSGMGPPPSMGPPNMPTATSPLLPNSHSHDGPMPPPSSTPNSHHQLGPDMMDNGITTTATGTLTTHVTAASGGSVTSVVTTGPDGAPIDEGSQQSTLSNTSAASGEDPQCTTPKSSRKNDMGHYSHPTTPQSTVPSPGAASMNSMHEEYGDLNSPSWPRTPASPVFNSHVPPTDTFRSKKTDSLGKLYEMDDNPDRRAWLDKLLAYMEERRTPILACPTISKNPLDLFRLYVFVKERGGFLEVSKNKTWKDIAGLLGIGASSSAAYTLRKHYTKNLLAYECQFDRGGIDPQPIINQIEASSKKKGAKSASVPSPGSSNSQDSFPAPGSGGASMDGYGGYGYPPSNNPDFNAPSQRPSSQANAPSPHAGSAGANHLGNAPARGPSPATGGSDNVNISNPFEDVSPSPPPRGGGGSGGGPFPGPHPPYPSVAPPRPQGQNYNNQVGYNQYPGPGPGAPPEQYSPYPAGTNYPPTSRTVYSPYSGDSPAPPSTSNNSQGGAPPAGQDPYNRYTMNTATGPAGYSPRPTYTGTPVAASGPVPGPGPGPGPTTQPPPGPYPAQEYYRPDQNYTNQQGAQTPATYPGGPPVNKNMPPPAPQQPRRHPDFANKEQQQQQQQAYPVQYGQRPQMYGGWPNNTQYRGQYGPATGPTGPGGPAGTQQWNQGGRPSGQWERYPAGTQGFQPPQQGQQQWSPMPTPGVGQSSPLRPPMGPRSGKPFAMLPPQSGKPTPSQVPGGSSLTQSQLPKREITFPPDSVEATLPVLYRRKRMCRSDLGPVDAWRIIMSLKSGLLTESCFALDVLNVLLFDDSSVAYFGLNQWPGLLELLLEHFRKSLSDMFDGKPNKDKPTPTEIEVDLGGVSSPIDPESRTVFLQNTTNYTNVSRKGFPVRMIDRSDDILVKDHQKAWDVRGDCNRASIILTDVVMDPWHHTVDHILPTFQAEFGHIPFCRTLEKEKKEIQLEKASLDKEPEPHRTPSPDVPPPASKPSDKKRRTKTLSDVISRIKKETIDDNGVLALEIKEKIKTEVVSETENCKEEEQPSTDLIAAVNVELNNELTVRDPACTLKRRRISDYEDEAYTRDDASLILLTESQDNIGKRCVCISNILRSLTFIPGNETEFANSPAFLSLVGKLLLLYHDHPIRTQKTRNYDREEDADFADSCSSLQGESEWWWEFLLQIRENMLVSTSNIAGYIDLDQYDEEVSRPLLDGLLHWAICPSAHGQDSFASVGPSSLLSPQRLALEALCKLCVTNGNVDLVIATPPFSRLERLCAVLTKHLCRSEDQVLREFSINLLHYLAAADSSMSRVIALQLPCISLLVAFIEQAEQSALGVANQHGIGALRENPDSMGTSLDMLRRAAATLVFLAQHPENKPLLVQQEPRLLALVMSQILDQQVALLLSKVLFQISRS